LGTDSFERISQNIYNRYYGSLELIKNLNQLEELDLNATDVESGLEYLPTQNLKLITFGDKGKIQAKVNALKKTLEFDEQLTSSKNAIDNQQKIGRITE
jgi:hypothetical protein